MRHFGGNSGCSSHVPLKGNSTSDMEPMIFRNDWLDRFLNSWIDHVFPSLLAKQENRLEVIGNNFGSRGNSICWFVVFSDDVFF